MTDTLFTVLGLPVTGFGLGMAGALLVALGVELAWCKARGVSYGVFIRFAALAVPLTLLCSRLLFVLAESTYYLTTLSNPALALRFWDGGYSLVGALLGMLLAAWAAEKLLRVPRRLLMDGLALALPAGILVERLCETGTGMGMGKTIATPALLFLGVEDTFTGEWVHPVYLYEAALAGIVGLGLLVWVLRRRGDTGAPGDLCGLFLLFFGVTQIVMECLRNDLHMVVHFVPVQQVVELLMVLAVLLRWQRRFSRVPGMKKGRTLWVWPVALVCVGVAVAMEFLVDRGPDKLLYYSVMSLCVAVIAALALICRKGSLKPAR